LSGIEQGLELRDAYPGNAYASEGEKVPWRLADAIDLWTGSQWVADTFGQDVQEHYANMGRIEIEAFDTGHLWFAKELVKEGVLAPNALVQLCMGVPWGAPNDLNTFMAMVNNVPADWNWSAFSLGRDQMPYVAAAVLAGGNVRVGLEDNLWLGKGQLATNAQLVERAGTIIENLGARLMTPAEVRAKLGLTKRAPRAH
ncbi:MAG: 3-keto-5-aminohexanoate cleavage protein, partial [Rhodobacteraceae bacterium]|nr:3-keto-5-aminohexanoate cleavage protein [Paracoccaceae bacterium]